MSPDVAPRILQTLRDRQTDMIALLEDLVRAESPSSEPETQHAVQALLRDPLEALGYRVRHLPGTVTGGHLYARPAGRTSGRPYQLLLGHTDTVWPVGTLATMPLRRDGDVLRGPGIFDMKGGLVQIVFALATLDALGLSPSVTPVVFLNSDEEIGSPESTPTIRRLARGADRALVLEPALTPEGHLKTTRRGSGRFHVEVKGRSAHAGLDPEAGASAIVELSRVVQRLHALNDPDRGISINVGRIEGGLRPNVVASEARAEVDVRIRMVEDAHRMETALHALTAQTPGTTVSVTGRIGRLPMEGTPRNRRLWRRAQEAGRRLGLDFDEGRSGGVSDGNTTSRFTATLDGLGAVGDGAHAAHEYLEPDRLPERAALLALLLLGAPLSPSDLASSDSADASTGARTTPAAASSSSASPFIHAEELP